MRARHPEMSEQLARVLHQPLHGDWRLGRRHLRLAMSAQIHAHEAIVAAELRYPRVVALRMSHRGVQQQQRRCLEPRVGEIVDRVGEFQSVARTEKLHGHLVMSCCGVSADDSIRYRLRTWNETVQACVWCIDCGGPLRGAGAGAKLSDAPD